MVISSLIADEGDNNPGDLEGAETAHGGSEDRGRFDEAEATNEGVLSDLFSNEGQTEFSKWGVGADNSDGGGELDVINWTVVSTVFSDGEEIEDFDGGGEADDFAEGEVDILERGLDFAEGWWSEGLVGGGETDDFEPFVEELEDEEADLAGEDIFLPRENRRR